MSRPVKAATCHPEKKHFAKGMCSSCYAREFRRAHPEYKEQMKVYSAKYRKDNPEKSAKYYEARRSDGAKRKRDALKQADNTYQTKYGMTLTDVEGMLASQGGKCKVCSTELTRTTANVDHCHVTGYVRGILCTNCNTGIGSLGDNVEGLKKALAYLESEPSTFRSGKYE